MATNNNEANELYAICSTYLAPRKLYSMFEECNEKIGVKTSNTSLKVSLQMLTNLAFEHMKKEDEKVTKNLWLYNILFKGLVSFHFLIVIINILSFFILPFYFSLFISVPLMSFIGWFSTSKIVDCPLTRLENKLRDILQKRRIKGFIGHYIVKPIRIKLKNIKQHESISESIG